MDLREPRTGNVQVRNTARVLAANIPGVNPGRTVKAHLNVGFFFRIGIPVVRDLVERKVVPDDVINGIEEMHDDPSVFPDREEILVRSADSVVRIGSRGIYDWITGLQSPLVAIMDAMSPDRLVMARVLRVAGLVPIAADNSDIAVKGILDRGGRAGISGGNGYIPAGIVIGVVVSGARASEDKVADLGFIALADSHFLS